MNKELLIYRICAAGFLIAFLAIGYLNISYDYSKIISLIIFGMSICYFGIAYCLIQIVYIQRRKPWYIILALIPPIGALVCLLLKPATLTIDIMEEE